jgi:hypothetical protein
VDEVDAEAGQQLAEPASSDESPVTIPIADAALAVSPNKAPPVAIAVEVLDKLPPARSGQMLAGFMEEPQYPVGERSAACSSAAPRVVISLWRTLEQIPYFPSSCSRHNRRHLGPGYTRLGTGNWRRQPRPFVAYRS